MTENPVEEKPVTGMLEENPGEISTMRVAVILTVVVILCVFVGLNVTSAINCLRHGKDLIFMDFPYHTGIVLVGALGLKAVQKFAEK